MEVIWEVYENGFYSLWGSMEVTSTQGRTYECLPLNHVENVEKTHEFHSL